MATRREYLTAEEVMEQLQVGRTFVYEQARLYLSTGGAQGLPCQRFGRLLRFPLDELESHGRPASPATGAPSAGSDLEGSRRRSATHAPKTPERNGVRPRRARTHDQSSLPFTS